MHHLRIIILQITIGRLLDDCWIASDGSAAQGSASRPPLPFGVARWQIRQTQRDGYGSTPTDVVSVCIEYSILNVI